MHPAEAQYFSQHIAALSRHFDGSMDDLDCDAVALYSGTPHIAFLDDYQFPFKPNPLFAWWGPIAEPECWIIYRPGERPLLIFMQPADYWHATAQDPAGFWVDSFEIRIVRSAAEAREQMPLNGLRLAAIGENLPDWDFHQVNPARLIHRLHWRRAAKTQYELGCMRQASILGARAHLAAADAFAAGDSEYQIHLKYLAACDHAEKELPYNNIIALNEHAAILHYQRLERVAPRARRTFLIDAGATYAGYASDITRTWTNGDGLFTDLVAALDERQLQMVQSVQPGRPYADLHFDCHRHLAEIMAEAGLLTCSAEAALEAGITTTFMPHGLGHLIGLQVHDVGGHQADENGAIARPPDQFPHLRTTRTLERDFVVTIEPGFYLIPMLLDQLREGPRAAMLAWETVDHLIPFGGVRIEDDVVAVDNTPENLTRDAFAAVTAG